MIQSGGGKYSVGVLSLVFAGKSNLRDGGDGRLSGSRRLRIRLLDRFEKLLRRLVEEMRYAAASLLAGAPNSSEAFHILKAGREKAQSDGPRLDFDVALAHGYLLQNRFAELLPIARRLLQLFPNSEKAFTLLTRSLMRLNEAKEAERIADERLRRLPNDLAALRVLQGVALSQNQFDKVDDYSKRLIATGKATPVDMNNAAWYALVRGTVTPEAIRVAQQAVETERNGNPNSLHTLASLYAETGQTAEARDLLLRSIELSGEDEPTSEHWYVVGRIAEQIGVKEAAITAYNKVEKPKVQQIDSTYMLAQRRLSALAKGESK